MVKQKFDVGGMSCAACSSGIEKAVSRLDGVKQADVSLLEKSMTVIYDESLLSAETIIATVERLGYTAAIFGVIKDKNSDAEKLKQRFFISLVFLLPLMYLSMGKMFGAPTFERLLGAGFAVDIALQFILATAIIAINFKFYTSGVRAVKNLSPNMDTLVFLGSFTAYVYSIVISALMISGAADKTHVFFEASAMVMTLVDLGKYLEEISKRKTGAEIEKLSKLLPKTVVREKGGKEETVLTSDLNKGDILILKAGDYCPVDGRVISGVAAVDKSAITGESIPIEAADGYNIVSGSTLKSGYIKVECENVGENTLFNKIVETVKTAGASKVPMQKFADSVAAVFVPIVVSIAVLTLILQIIFNAGDFGYAVKCAISVVVISCPCALGLATPVAVMAGTGRAAALGILYKDGEALQKARNIDCVLFDKTATLTGGKPKVIDFINLSDKPDGEIFAISSALEKMSNHPLGAAIREFCGDTDKVVNNYSYETGKGITGEIDGTTYFLGNFGEEKYFTDKTTVSLFSCGKCLAVFGISDTVKPDSKAAVSALKENGITTVMITGDNKAAAESVAAETGIERYEYSVLPTGKAEYVNKYKEQGYFTAFVGDGINDSPALKTADVGISLDSGTDIAIESADIVLVGGSVSKVSEAINLSKKTVRIIKENLFWAFFYNAVMIPIAAGAFAFIGIKFEPYIAALCMSVSSLFVVLNALRINKYGKKSKNKKTGEGKMILTVEGMMCEHCKKRVKEATESVSGVKSAEIDLKKKTVKIIGDADISKVKAAITAAGYKIIE
ncbi:MAG: cadmium-translocating P-type ATPase [Clostridia bacterium]|nr:cadmium-translocating P-type ATPase [Clostridia bacterium]